MKEYQLVLRVKGGRVYAYYMDAHTAPAYDFDSMFVVGYTVKEALTKAKTIKPDGVVLFTYIDNNEG